MRVAFQLALVSSIASLLVLAAGRDASATFRRLPATACFTSGDYGGDYRLGFDQRGSYLVGTGWLIVADQVPTPNSIQTNKPFGGANIGNQAGYNRVRQVICPIIDDSTLSHEDVDFIAIDGSDSSVDKALRAITCIANRGGIPGDACGSFSFSTNANGGSTTNSNAFSLGGFFLLVDPSALRDPGFTHGYGYVVIDLPSTTDGKGLWVSGLFYSGS